MLPSFAMQPDPGGTQDIFEAIEFLSLDSIKHWLGQGVDPNIIDPKSKKTPLQYMMEQGQNWRIIKLLLDRGAAADSILINKIFMQALSARDDEMIEILQKKGFALNFDQRDNKGETLLITAITAGNDQNVTFLIEHGANPYLEDKHGDNAFRYATLNPELMEILNRTKHNPRNIFQAIISDRIDWVTQWLIKNPDINATDGPYGDSPLIYAIRYYQKNLIPLLLSQKNIDVNVVNNDDDCALSLALVQRDLDLIQLLVKAGANIEQLDKKGRTALMQSTVLGGDLKIVTWLLDQKANIEATNNDGQTPLMVTGGATITELLLSRGANINATDKNGHSALQIAADRNNLNKIKVLLDRGAAIDDALARTIFNQAVQANNHTLLASLLERTIPTDFDVPNEQGETALIENIIKNRPNIVTVLMQYGANPYAKNKYGYDAFLYAKNNPRMIAILRQQEHENPELLTTVASSDVLTPTEAHYRKKEIGDAIESKYGERSKYGTQGYPLLQNHIVQQCMANERLAYQQNKYVFYRSEPGKYRIYEFFLDELHTLMRPFIKTNKSFIFARFFKDAASEQTINEYIDTKPWQAHKLGASKNVLLSVNIPLFGNVNNIGSCSWYYFLNNEEATGGVELPLLFERIFDLYDFNKKYIDQLLSLQTGLLEKEASLQQIIIPKSIVNDVAMFATHGYCFPWPTEVDPSCWDPQAVSAEAAGIGKVGKETFGRHTCIASIIDKYRNGEIEIDDNMQARILMNAVYGLNPNSGIEFHLYTRVSEEVINDLKKKVKKIADELFGEWLAKQIDTNDRSMHMESEEFHDALRYYGKDDPERQKTFFEAFKAAKTRKAQQAGKDIQAQGDLTIQEKGEAIAQQAARVAQERAQSGIRRMPSVEKENKKRALTRKGEEAETKEDAYVQEHLPASIWQAYATEGVLDRATIAPSFIKDCARDAVQNQRIPEKTPGIVRIAIYNVHFWTDPLKQKNYPSILETIKTINADILLLQEVRLFNPEKIENDFKALGYTHQTFMSMKLWGNDPFGNMIVSKHPYIGEPVKKIYDSDKEQSEKRNFINRLIQLPHNKTISLYNTHLDVRDATGLMRTLEAQELVETAAHDINQNVLLAGDWNAVRQRDYQYHVSGKLVWDLQTTNFIQWQKASGVQNIMQHIPTEPLDLIEKHRFKDCFTQAGGTGPYYTVWTGTVVDFIFCAQTWNLPIVGCYIYYSAASDHLPVIMDVNIVKDQDKE